MKQNNASAPESSIAMRERTIKIEASGDFWIQDIKPKIRLCGLWLKKAGFKPGKRVRVISERPGELKLQSIEPPNTDTGGILTVP